MTDDRLDREFARLRAAMPPEPDDAVRRRASTAAMDAFDRSQARKKAATDPQGVRSDRRHSSEARPGLWSIVMQNRLAIGGVAACLVAVPLTAALVMQNGGLSGLGHHAPTTSGEPPQQQTTELRHSAPPPAEPLVKEKQALGRGDAASAPRSFEQERMVDAAQGAPVPPAAAGAPMARREMRFQTDAMPQRPVAENRDRFEGKPSNGLKVTSQEPVSTFSIDADTASYAWVRRSLKQGRVPAPGQIRVEELINYFPYDYPRPDSAATPFRPTVQVYPTPWNAETRIVHIGIKGLDPKIAARPKANLVFLIDTSGSMNAQDKLPLVKASLKLLLSKLDGDDHVGIVTYAGAAGVALESTPASEKDKIVAAIDRLGAGGSTAGAAGLEEAYRLARKNFDEKGVNRVLLATDGDFNVGVSDDDGLTRLIETERRSGVFLSVLGFGQGNYNDALMQRLAQNGNGTAAYIDELDEAQKVLVEEATSTLFPIAKDVKIQVEFNPAQVSEYRLIGYESRMLDRTAFNDDKVDAGEVGSGAAVTALYEITPVGSKARKADDLRYAAPAAEPEAGQGAGEFGFLKIRYKLPNEETSRLIEQPIDDGLALGDLAAASDDVRFAAAVAAFGQKLRRDREVSAMSWDDVAALAEGARGADRWGYRAGFVRLVALAKALSRE